MSNIRRLQVVNPYFIHGEKPRLPRYVTVSQRPIPWCLNHDSPYASFIEEKCLMRDVRANSEQWCSKSVGGPDGPDHKWWEDVQPDQWIVPQ